MRVFNDAYIFMSGSDLDLHVNVVIAVLFLHT